MRLGVFSALVASFGFAHCAQAGGPVHVDRGHAEGAPWIEFYSGVDVVKDTVSLTQHLEVAFNRNLSRDGFVLRVHGNRVTFEYDDSQAPEGVVKGTGWQGDVMLGYKVAVGLFEAAAYAGVDHQRYKLKPDDITERIRGSETGFKVAGTLETGEAIPVYFGLQGEYSNVFDTYWARAQLGLRLGHVKVGPEAHVSGDVSYKATRIGAFLSADLKLSPRMEATVSLAAGRQRVDNKGNNDLPDDDTDQSGRGGGNGTYYMFGIGWRL